MQTEHGVRMNAVYRNIIFLKITGKAHSNYWQNVDHRAHNIPQACASLLKYLPTTLEQKFC